MTSSGLIASKLASENSDPGVSVPSPNGVELPLLLSESIEEPNDGIPLLAEE